MKICSGCGREFKPSSGHLLCPACRRQDSKDLCACGERKQPTSATCRSCQPTAGEANGNWRGGTTMHKAGYLMRHVPGHPRGPKRPYVFEHILVMEEMLGRLPASRRDHPPPERSQGRQPAREPRALGEASAGRHPRIGCGGRGLARSLLATQGTSGSSNNAPELIPSTLGAGGNRTPVRRAVDARATTIPEIAPLRLAHRRVGGARKVPAAESFLDVSGLSRRQWSLPTVRHCFCCRAAVARPRVPSPVTGALYYLVGTRRRERTARWQLFWCPV